MTPQEQELLSTFLDNLGRARPESQDPEAAAMIRRAVANQPDAAYILVQQALLQEIALRNAQARIADLEEHLRQARGGSAGASSGSFLGGAGLGRPSPGRGWSNTPSPAFNELPPSAGPGGERGGWHQPGPAQGPMPQSTMPDAQPSGGPMPGQGLLGRGGQPSAVSGFLTSAAAAAAGVAGGALLFQGLEHLIGGAHASGLGTGTTPTIEETVINEHGNASAPDETVGDWSENNADASDTGQDLSDDDTDDGNFGGDDGSDWA